jgi:hypothetical protein
MAHLHQLLRWQAEATEGEGGHLEVDTDETNTLAHASGLLHHYQQDKGRFWSSEHAEMHA